MLIKVPFLSDVSIYLKWVDFVHISLQNEHFFSCSCNIKLFDSLCLKSFYNLLISQVYFFVSVWCWHFQPAKFSISVFNLKFSLCNFSSASFNCPMMRSFYKSNMFKLATTLLHCSCVLSSRLAFWLQLFSNSFSLNSCCSSCSFNLIANSYLIAFLIWLFKSSTIFFVSTCANLDEGLKELLNGDMFIPLLLYLSRLLSIRLL